ncbi:butyrophilin subfamily 3 member A1-like isoform X8 [Corvus moneduloides]|uniref:butyrophilin subfamily 3 member A1-like isoform X8 n=1 Tax=Corvus moneduloides TaxID=1196302 RepID=UPI0013622349|nr:butyrophilin subfamily 3 member A1-like isoform X8 [Corvus moneduloides]
MEQRRWLLLALALLLAIPVSEHFKVTSPEKVVGIVGQDTILPCTISSTKPLDNPQVHWIKITDGHTEDIYTYRHFGGEPMQKYCGRTSVPGDGFATGNVSLTLKNVQPADEGRYICSVESSVWFAENDTKLSVAGTGEVFIDVLGYQEKGLELGCRSQGWFPKPTVQWVNEDGQGLSADTEIHQDSRNLFSVWSRVTVTGEQVGKVTCQILNPLLQVEKKTTLSLSGDAFPRVSPGLPAFWTVFTLFLLTLAAAAAVLVYRAMLLCSTVLDKRKTEEANISQALESRLEKDLKQLSQQIQTLIQAFQNMQESTERDLLMIRTDLENKRGMTEEGNATMILESTWQKDLQQISHQLQNLQQILHNMQMSTQRDLQLLRTELENKQELSKVESYKGKHRGDDGGDVTLDADTAHPRLEISADGQKVKDTGVIRQVPSNEKRFDSHLFVLAKEGYTSGKHYWEVSVGRRRSWALGIARESVTRKGPLTLCPQNGFWAIGLADGRDCWAYTDRWTRLSVSGHLHKIGIFLNIPAKKLRFYNARTGATLYTFNIADGSSQEGKFIPFLSTGPATSEHEPEPLLIV